MRTRVFLWGLSNGIFFLSLASLFWLGLGLGPYAGTVEWYVDALVMLLVYGSCGASLWGAIRIRRRSGFQRSDLRSSDPVQKSQNRRVVTGFLSVVTTQALLVGLAVVVCFPLGDKILMWSLIAMIVSLHFIPLGRVFGVRAYYIVGIVGTVLSLFSFAPGVAQFRMLYLGVAMGLLMLGSAVYLITKADEIALKSVREAPEPEMKEEEQYLS